MTNIIAWFHVWVGEDICESFTHAHEDDDIEGSAKFLANNLAYTKL